MLCAAVQQLHGETEEPLACAHSHPTLTGECLEQLRVFTQGYHMGEFPRETKTITERQFMFDDRAHKLCPLQNLGDEGGVVGAI